MIDAKGPGYSGVLGFGPGRDSIAEKWLTQADSQIAAAGGRNVIWYFAEAAAADYARSLFSSDERHSKIIVRVQPAVLQ